MRRSYLLKPRNLRGARLRLSTRSVCTLPHRHFIYPTLSSVHWFSPVTGQPDGWVLLDFQTAKVDHLNLTRTQVLDLAE